MNIEKIKGKFNVIESFAIRNKEEFYLIGNLTEGQIEEKWFISVVLNGSLSLTLRVSNIEEVEITSDKQNYKLLTVPGDNETINILLGLNIGSEILNVTIDGKD